MNRHESHEDPTLIELGRVTTEDSSESSEGAVHRDDGPMDEGSSSNGHGTQTSESSNLQIAKEETKAVVSSGPKLVYMWSWPFLPLPLLQERGITSAKMRRMNLSTR